MKKLSIFLVLTYAAILLCVGCAAHVELTEPPKPVSWLLEYPNLSWGMTPDEARTALEVTNEQQSIGDYLVLHDIRKTVFGAENADIYLYFIDLDKDGVWRLSRVMVALPHNADLNSIAEQIEAHYGFAPEYTEKVRLDSGNSQVDTKCWDWASDAALEDILSESDTEHFHSLDEFFHSRLTNPATTISLDNDGYYDLILDGIPTKNLLTFSTMYTTYQLEGGFSTTAEFEGVTE